VVRVVLKRFTDNELQLQVTKWTKILAVSDALNLNFCGFPDTDCHRQSARLKHLSWFYAGLSDCLNTPCLQIIDHQQVTVTLSNLNHFQNSFTAVTVTMFFIQSCDKHIPFFIKYMISKLYQVYLL